jgi:hypothetical protein
MPPRMPKPIPAPPCKRYPSFLHWLAVQVLGQPRWGAAWNCPFCDKGGEMEWACFSVRPPKVKLPIKWACHRCHRWGDEYD